MASFGYDTGKLMDGQVATVGPGGSTKFRKGSPTKMFSGGFGSLVTEMAAETGIDYAVSAVYTHMAVKEGLSYIRTQADAGRVESLAWGLVGNEGQAAIISSMGQLVAGDDGRIWEFAPRMDFMTMLGGGQNDSFAMFEYLCPHPDAVYEILSILAEECQTIAEEALQVVYEFIEEVQDWLAVVGYW